MLHFLCFLAGAAHVFAPDHWVPSSMLAWRRRWSEARTVAFVTFVLSVHVLAGLVLYRLLEAVLGRTHAHGWRVFAGTLVFVAALSLLRIARYSHVRTVLRMPPDGLLWSTVSVIAVIGPAEALVPVLVRSLEVGAGILVPLLAFWSGTMVAGLSLSFVGPWIWDRPLLLPRSLAWAERPGATIPIVLGVAVAATFLLR